VSRNPYAPPQVAVADPTTVPSLAEKRRAPLGTLTIATLALPAVVCFAAWAIQAFVNYPIDSEVALPTAVGLVGGSAAAVLSVVVLALRIARSPHDRKWSTYLVLGISLVAVVPSALVLVALAFR